MDQIILESFNLNVNPPFFRFKSFFYLLTQFTKDSLLLETLKTAVLNEITQFSININPEMFEDYIDFSEYIIINPNNTFEYSFYPDNNLFLKFVLDYKPNYAGDYILTRDLIDQMKSFHKIQTGNISTVKNNIDLWINFSKNSNFNKSKTDIIRELGNWMRQPETYDSKTVGRFIMLSFLNGSEMNMRLIQQILHICYPYLDFVIDYIFNFYWGLFDIIENLISKYTMPSICNFLKSTGITPLRVTNYDSLFTDRYKLNTPDAYLSNFKFQNEQYENWKPITAIDTINISMLQINLNVDKHILRSSTFLDNLWLCMFDQLDFIISYRHIWGFELDNLSLMFGQYRHGTDKEKLDIENKFQILNPKKIVIIEKKSDPINIPKDFTNSIVKVINDSKEQIFQGNVMENDLVNKLTESISDSADANLSQNTQLLKEISFATGDFKESDIAEFKPIINSDSNFIQLLALPQDDQEKVDKDIILPGTVIPLFTCPVKLPDKLNNFLFNILEIQKEYANGNALVNSNLISQNTKDRNYLIFMHERISSILSNLKGWDKNKELLKMSEELGDAHSYIKFLLKLIVFVTQEEPNEIVDDSKTILEKTIKYLYNLNLTKQKFRIDEMSIRLGLNKKSIAVLTSTLNSSSDILALLKVNYSLFNPDFTVALIKKEYSLFSNLVDFLLDNHLLFFSIVLRLEQYICLTRINLEWFNISSFILTIKEMFLKELNNNANFNLNNIGDLLYFWASIYIKSSFDLESMLRDSRHDYLISKGIHNSEAVFTILNVINSKENIGIYNDLFKYTDDNNTPIKIKFYRLLEESDIEPIINEQKNMQVMQAYNMFYRDKDFNRDETLDLAKFTETFFEQIKILKKDTMESMKKLETEILGGKTSIEKFIAHVQMLNFKLKKVIVNHSDKYTVILTDLETLNFFNKESDTLNMFAFINYLSLFNFIISKSIGNVFENLTKNTIQTVIQKDLQNLNMIFKNVSLVYESMIKKIDDIQKKFILDFSKTKDDPFFKNEELQKKLIEKENEFKKTFKESLDELKKIEAENKEMMDQYKRTFTNSLRDSQDIDDNQDPKIQSTLNTVYLDLETQSTRSTVYSTVLEETEIVAQNEDSIELTIADFTDKTIYQERKKITLSITNIWKKLKYKKDHTIEVFAQISQSMCVINKAMISIVTKGYTPEKYIKIQKHDKLIGNIVKTYKGQLVSVTYKRSIIKMFAVELLPENMNKNPMSFESAFKNALVLMKLDKIADFSSLNYSPIVAYNAIRNYGDINKIFSALNTLVANKSKYMNRKFTREKLSLGAQVMYFLIKKTLENKLEENNISKTTLYSYKESLEILKKIKIQKNVTDLNVNFFEKVSDVGINDYFFTNLRVLQKVINQTDFWDNHQYKGTEAANYMLMVKPVDERSKFQVEYQLNMLMFLSIFNRDFYNGLLNRAITWNYQHLEILYCDQIMQGITKKSEKFDNYKITLETTLKALETLVFQNNQFKNEITKYSYEINHVIKSLKNYKNTDNLIEKYDTFKNTYSTLIQKMNDPGVQNNFILNVFYTMLKLYLEDFINLSDRIQDLNNQITNLQNQIKPSQNFVEQTIIYNKQNEMIIEKELSNSFNQSINDINDSLSRNNGNKFLTELFYGLYKKLDVLSIPGQSSVLLMNHFKKIIEQFETGSDNFVQSVYTTFYNEPEATNILSDLRLYINSLPNMSTYQDLLATNESHVNSIKNLNEEIKNSKNALLKADELFKKNNDMINEFEKQINSISSKMDFNFYSSLTTKRYNKDNKLLSLLNSVTSKLPKENPFISLFKDIEIDKSKDLESQLKFVTNAKNNAELVRNTLQEDLNEYKQLYTETSEKFKELQRQTSDYDKNKIQIQELEEKIIKIESEFKIKFEKKVDSLKKAENEINELMKTNSAEIKKYVELSRKCEVFQNNLKQFQKVYSFDIYTRITEDLKSSTKFTLNQISNTQSTLEKTQKEKLQIENELIEKKKEIEVLNENQKSLQKLTNELDNLSIMINQKESNISELNLTISRLNTQYEEQLEEKTKLSEKIEINNENLQKAKDANDILKTNNEKLDKEILTIKADLVVCKELSLVKDRILKVYNEMIGYDNLVNEISGQITDTEIKKLINNWGNFKNALEFLTRVEQEIPDLILYKKDSFTNFKGIIENAKKYKDLLISFQNQSEQIQTLNQLILTKDKEMQDFKAEYTISINTGNIRISRYEIEIKFKDERMKDLQEQVQKLKNSQSEQINILDKQNFNQKQLYDSELEKFTTELGKKNTEIQKLENEISILKGKKTQLENNNEQMTTKLNKIIIQLEDEKKSLTRDLNNLKDQVKFQPPKNITTSVEYQFLLTEKKNLENKIANFDKKIKELESQYNDSTKTINLEHNAEILNVKTAMESLNKLLEEKNYEIEKIKSDSEDKISQLQNEFKLQISTLKKEIAEKDAKIVQENLRLTSEISNLSIQYTNVLNTFDELNETINRLLLENAKYKEKLKELKKFKIDSVYEIHSKNQTIAELQEEKEITLKKIQEMDEINKKIAEHNENLLNEITQLKKSKDMHEIIIVQLNAKFNSEKNVYLEKEITLNSRIKTLADENKRLVDLNNLLTEENSRLKDLKQKLENEFNLFKNETTSIKNQYENLLSLYKNETAKLKTQTLLTSEQKETINNLTDSVSTLTSEIQFITAKNNSEINKLKLGIADLEEKTKLDNIKLNLSKEQYNKLLRFHYDTFIDLFKSLIDKYGSDRVAIFYLNIFFNGLKIAFKKFFEDNNIDPHPDFDLLKLDVNLTIDFIKDTFKIEHVVSETMNLYEHDVIMTDIVEDQINQINFTIEKNKNQIEEIKNNILEPIIIVDDIKNKYNNLLDESTNLNINLSNLQSEKNKADKEIRILELKLKELLQNEENIKDENKELKIKIVNLENEYNQMVLKYSQEFINENKIIDSMNKRESSKIDNLSNINKNNYESISLDGIKKYQLMIDDIIIKRDDTIQEMILNAQMADPAFLELNKTIPKQVWVWSDNFPIEYEAYSIVGIKYTNGTNVITSKKLFLLAFLSRFITIKDLPIIPKFEEENSAEIQNIIFDWLTAPELLFLVVGFGDNCIFYNVTINFNNEEKYIEFERVFNNLENVVVTWDDENKNLPHFLKRQVESDTRGLAKKDIIVFGVGNRYILNLNYSYIFRNYDSYIFKLQDMTLSELTRICKSLNYYNENQNEFEIKRELGNDIRINKNIIII